jgi:hypothetical protein
VPFSLSAMVMVGAIVTHAMIDSSLTYGLGRSLKSFSNTYEAVHQKEEHVWSSHGKTARRFRYSAERKEAQLGRSPLSQLAKSQVVLLFCSCLVHRGTDR